jgi:hypothetical protein
MPVPFVYDEHGHLLTVGLLVGLMLFALFSIYSLMLS